jgi:hypothetical protein
VLEGGGGTAKSVARGLGRFRPVSIISPDVDQTHVSI